MAKRLYRSSRERILGGVSGGLAEYFDVDVTLIRLAWILLALAGGTGLLAYIIAWIIIPERPRRRRQDSPAPGQETGEAEMEAEMIEVRPGDEDESRERHGEGKLEAEEEKGERKDGPRFRGGRGERSGSWLLGVILVAVGLFLLIQNLFPWFTFLFWPVLLIVAGILVLTGAFRR